MNEPLQQRVGRAKRELANWARQNMEGESFKVAAYHNYAGIIRDNKAAFAAHPEYYMLLNGKRVRRGICSSNPAVRRMAVDRALKYFAEHPDADMFSMERGDGNAACQCANCKALGSISDRVFGLANEVAKAVAAKYPGKMVGVLGYNAHDLPPDFPLEPNVHVQVARLFSQSGLSFHKRIALWRKATPNLGIYDYFSTFQWGQDRLRAKAESGPTANLNMLTGDIRYMAKEGALSLWSECSIAWGAHGRGNYIATKLMWNPNADVEALLQDFYDKAFGPAAPAMKRYFNLVDGRNEYFSRTLLGLAFRDVEEASKLAKGRPDVEARIDEIKQYLYYNYIVKRSREAKTPAEKKKWFLAMLTHEFRTRYTYMTHWTARKYYFGVYARKFKAPDWALPGWRAVRKAAKDGITLPTPPWLVNKPCTHEETQRDFMEGLNYFQPVALLEKATYSMDLVPVAFPDAPAPKASRQAFIYPTKDRSFYLYSIDGKPLTLDIVNTSKSSFTEYELFNKDDKVVASGPIERKSGHQLLKMPVPAAGLYRFAWKGGGIMNCAVPPGTPLTIVLKSQSGTAYTLNGLGGRMYFYVPKSTRQFQYYWKGGKHPIFNPDGKVARMVTVSDNYVTIPVPPGMDGKVWSFSGRYFPRHFVNIPNGIAPSPQALLIPRELAVEDGLRIRASR